MTLASAAVMKCGEWKRLPRGAGECAHPSEKADGAGVEGDRDGYLGKGRAHVPSCARKPAEMHQAESTSAILIHCYLIFDI